MAAGLKDARTFFTKGTVAEWEFILTLYKEALHLKAQQKNKKPEELVKLDTWFQEELPKLIHSRKEKHLTHDEIVQTMKWKLARGKWRPRLTDLVKINTPLAVMQVSKKAFRRLPNLAFAVQALSGLKGVGPATASAILAAGAPELAPFMADECLMAIPECQAIDYTVQEYLIYTEQIQTVVERLNAAAKNCSWNPHRVEKALWTFCIISEFCPSLLVRMPSNGIEDDVDNSASQNGKSSAKSDETKDQVSEEDASEQRNADVKDVVATSKQPKDENGRQEVERGDQEVTETTTDNDQEEDSNVSASGSSSCSGFAKRADEDSVSAEDTRDSVIDEPAYKKLKIDK